MLNRPLRRVVIKEELVALTGDFMSALVLNQLLYWTRRVQDHDDMLQEEMAVARAGGQDLTLQLRHGWIWKKAEELSEELMIDKSKQTIGRIISQLVSRGWVNERRNPHVAWDRTKQYRVNLSALQRDLQTLGYSLEGYKLDLADDTSKFQNGTSENPGLADTNPAQISQNAKFQNGTSDFQNGISVFHDGTAISEITPEITPEITLGDRPSVRLSDHPTVSRKVTDGQTEAETVQELLAIFDRVRLSDNKPRQDLWQPVLEYMFWSPAFANAQGMPIGLIRKRMQYITAATLDSAFKRVSEHVAVTGVTITNKTAYLATAVFNEIGKQPADQALDPGFLTTL